MNSLNRVEEDTMSDGHGLYSISRANIRILDHFRIRGAALCIERPHNDRMAWSSIDGMVRTKMFQLYRKARFLDLVLERQQRTKG
jgi:hypothetical protein